MVHRLGDVDLAPGERHVQHVVREDVGFALGRSDGLYVYRFEDRRLADGVEWRGGAAPRGKSLARVPDATGNFVPGARPTPGAVNAPSAP